MKDLRLIAMTGVILASSIGFVSEEGIYELKPAIQQLYLANNEKCAENKQPPKKESRYPERFPASLRTCDFTRLNPNNISKF